MFKKLIATALSAAVIFTCSGTVFAQDLMLDGRFYAKQVGYDACTLASSAMMLSRRAYLNGDENWNDITEGAVRPYAWSNGLSHHFTYNGMTVSYGTLSSYGNEAELIALLDEHPEGIVAYNRGAPHAILLTDYTDGVFYCADPAIGASYGRIPASYATISLSGVLGYWYVSSDTATHLEAQPVDDLTILGMFYPQNLREGSTFSLGGILKYPAENPLLEVEIKIVDATGTVVQQATNVPEAGATEWAFRTLDKDILFNTLPAGEYGFSFVAKDAQSTTLSFARAFTVSGNSTETGYYWSANTPSA